MESEMRRVVASNRFGEKIAKSNFRHVSHGNFDDTQLAIEAYLLRLGRPKQGHLAELIMLMERSFSGKYRKGERSHYQQIMPSANWRPGDTLSEKLTRCKDKETFKNRFGFIGTTAILKRNHFDDYEIRNLDFEDRMYLRLIDTKDYNRSYFYRNDVLVDAFIELAIGFYRGGLNRKNTKNRGLTKGNPAMVSGGNPEVVYLENPKPLLYTEFDSRNNSRKSKGTSLTLVHSSNTTINQKQPRKEIEIKAGNDLRFEDIKSAIEVGLLPESYITELAIERAKPDMSKVRGVGYEVFCLWRTSVLEIHSGLCISGDPSRSTARQASSLASRFLEHFPDRHILEFFRHLVKNWGRAIKFFKSNGQWKIKGEYPEIHTVLEYSDHVLSWYKRDIDRSEHKGQKFNQVVASSECADNNKKGPAVPFVGCSRETAPGRTFFRSHRESLEYQLACQRMLEKFEERMPSAARYGVWLIDTLQNNSIDQDASNARVELLRNMSDDELIKYCC